MPLISKPLLYSNWGFFSVPSFQKLVWARRVIRKFFRIGFLEELWYIRKGNRESFVKCLFVLFNPKIFSSKTGTTKLFGIIFLKNFLVYEKVHQENFCFFLLLFPVKMQKRNHIFLSFTNRKIDNRQKVIR